MTEFRTNNLSTGIPPFLANSRFLPYYDPRVWYQGHSLSFEFVAVLKSYIFPTDCLYVTPWNLECGYQCFREICHLQLQAALYIEDISTKSCRKFGTCLSIEAE